MVSIDTSLVKKDVKKLISISQGVKKSVKAAFEQLESDPSAFPPLSTIPSSIQKRYAGLTLRKIKITPGSHNFRMIFAHWKLRDGDQHVDVLLVFPRSDGYELDWEWIESELIAPE